MEQNRYGAVVLAAGSGSRMRSKTAKQYMLLNGKPLIYYALAQFQESMASPYQFYLGAFLKGEFVGFLSYIEIAKEIDIHHLVVKNEAQKKGIGRKLLTFSIQDAFSRGVDAIVLEVRPSNVPAHTLYKKMNFKEIGRRKSYYHYPTEDGIIMKLENAQLEE